MDRAPIPGDLAAMASRDQGIFKVKVSSIDDKICHFAVIIDLGSKTVKEVHAAAGTDGEFRERPLNEAIEPFLEWVQEVRYYYRVDANLTQDLERVVKHSIRDPEVLGKLVDAFKTGKTGDIDYAMGTELTHILGDKNPRIEVALLKMDEQKASATEAKGDGGADGGSNKGSFKQGTFLPMGFVMAPINGTFLPRVPLGTSVVVKFIKPAEPTTKGYIANHKGPDEEHPERAHAYLRELNQVPGTSQIQVIVELPGGQQGEIIEDSQDIKIKLAPTHAPKKKKKSRTPASSTGYDMGPKSSGFSPEFLMPFVIGSIFAVSIALGMLYVLLSFL